MVCDAFAEIIARSPLYNSPELNGLSSLEPAGPTTRRVRSTFALGAKREERQLSSETSDVELGDLAYLNLDLASHQLDGQAVSLDKEMTPSAAAVVDGALDEDLVDHDVERNQSTPKPASEESEDHATPRASVDDVTDTAGATSANENDQTVGEKTSHASFHLSKMRISEQLRSMSQLSGPSDDSDRLTPEAWTFHRRERSNSFITVPQVGSNRSRYMHHTSESGIDSAQVPASWGQVTKDPDASSSIYSRPTSPEMPEPREIPTNLAAVADWPLKTETCTPADDVLPQADSEKENCHLDAEGDSHIAIVEPDLPTIAVHGATHDEANADSSSPVIALNRALSHKSGSSSTTKHSRFLERFTPPKKLVRKRRSIFKFLRAGSRRNQTRSISTPVLCSPHLRPFVDGPSDENDLLTVQYELTSQETDPVRSVSLNNLPSTAVNESEGVASSPDLRRKPSLAEYERHLSVTGDNRRRPSARDLNRLSVVEENDRHEHVSAKMSFSYCSKIQDTDPLMQAALERQLREKALFRSPSKNSVPFSQSSSLSFLATSWDEPSSAQPQSPDRDPLDSEGKRASAAHLSPPRAPIDGRSRTSSFSNQKPTTSKKPIVLHTPSSVSRDSIKSRIGSSLDSWSRYPSHTRGDRCASAGPCDNVRTFDFALNIKHERIRGTDESDPFNPGKRVLTETSTITRASKRSLPKSRSATFGNFVRYYSNLFTSPDFHGKGRRTSVAAGGRLEHPELEIPPHVLPADGGSHPVVYAHEPEPLRPGHSTHIDIKTSSIGEETKDATSDNKHPHGLSPPSARPVSFRGDSVFKPNSPKQDTKHEISATSPNNISQSDDSQDYFSAEHTSTPNSPTNPAEQNRDLDGTTETTDPVKLPTPSKAQNWSESYKDCLIVPPSPATHSDEDAKAMPPPSLVPNKRRPPAQASQQQFSLDPSAAIRRFPSVTVVDDRKGHWRSVSFISVQSTKSTASAASFVRESSNDLLKLMELREREEREKLLMPVV
jgi:hypothetical protein